MCEVRICSSSSYWLLGYMRSAKLGLCWFCWYCRPPPPAASITKENGHLAPSLCLWLWKLHSITKYRGQTIFSALFSTHLMLVLVGWRCEFETIQTSLYEILTKSKYWNEIYISCRRLDLTNILILESKNISLFMSSKFFGLDILIEYFAQFCFFLQFFSWNEVITRIKEKLKKF